MHLKEGFKPLFMPLYSLSQGELEELKKLLQKNLVKGFISASSAPCAALILIAKKKDGSLRLYVDYRRLNVGIIKNHYQLSLIQDMLIQLKKATWYTKLNICKTFNLLHMAPGDEWKMTFRTREKLFEFLVMPFGLTNTPASF